MRFITDDNTKLLALEPVPDQDILPHKSTFVNELKISDFKQVLSKNNIQSEFYNGALWCANSTIAIRRVCWKLKQNSTLFFTKISFIFTD